MTKGKAIPTDVYDKEGNMTKIEFNDGKGEFILQFLWDERDDQTSENRTAFRKWAYRWMEDKGWNIVK
jgi:hypothetical protein